MNDAATGQTSRTQAVRERASPSIKVSLARVSWVGSLGKYLILRATTGTTTDRAVTCLNPEADGVMRAHKWHGTPIVTMQAAAQCLIHTKSGLSYTWIAGFGPHEVLYAADLMEFACHVSRDEAMDLAGKIFARIDELAPKFERMTRTPTVVDFYDLETMEPLEKHLEVFEQAKEELAKLGVVPA